jgi:hypothetical protein
MTVSATCVTATPGGRNGFHRSGAKSMRHALRSLARQPAFTTVAVVTLAVGISAATAMFSVVRGVLLRPLPVADPDRVVRVSPLVALRAES